MSFRPRQQDERDGGVLVEIGIDLVDHKALAREEAVITTDSWQVAVGTILIKSLESREDVGTHEDGAGSRVNEAADDVVGGSVVQWWDTDRCSSDQYVLQIEVVPSVNFHLGIGELSSVTRGVDVRDVENASSDRGNAHSEESLVDESWRASWVARVEFRSEADDALEWISAEGARRSLDIGDSKHSRFGTKGTLTDANNVLGERTSQSRASSSICNSEAARAIVLGERHVEDAG